MRTFSGIDDLLAQRATFPDSGWIFVDKDVEPISEAQLRARQFFMAEDGDEEFDMEDTHRTWLEAPMFLAIVQQRLEKNRAAPVSEIIAAAIHYLDKDTFMP